MFRAKTPTENFPFIEQFVLNANFSSTPIITWTTCFVIRNHLCLWNNCKSILPSKFSHICIEGMLTEAPK